MPKKSPEADFSRQSRKKIANCDIGDRQCGPWGYTRGWERGTFLGRSKTRKWENTEVSPKWVLERSYLEKYST